MLSGPIDGGIFFFQAEDGIRDLVRSRGLGDVYKRQLLGGEQRVAQVVPIGVAATDERQQRRHAAGI